MYIKRIEVKNFKCLENIDLEFNIPNKREEGSGLNILVGENNTGKSTILEAIHFLRNGLPKDKTPQDIKNKNVSESEFIVALTFAGNIKSVVEHFGQDKKKSALIERAYENEEEKGEEFLQLRRSSNEISNLGIWNEETSELGNPSGIDAVLKRLFEFNALWVDTNPNDEIKASGKTICWNLLKEIVEKFKEKEGYQEYSKVFEQTFNDDRSEFKKELKGIEKQTKDIIANQFGDVDIKFHFSELSVQKLLTNTTIRVDDGVLTDMKETGSGVQRSIALALLQVYAEVSAKKLMMILSLNHSFSLSMNLNFVYIRELKRRFLRHCWYCLKSNRFLLRRIRHIFCRMRL